jgi:hypothetical protein
VSAQRWRRRQNSPHYNHSPGAMVEFDKRTTV